MAPLVADARGSLRSRWAGLAPDALSFRTRDPRVAWRAGGSRYAGAKEATPSGLSPLSFLPGIAAVALLPLQFIPQLEYVEQGLPW